MDGVHLNIAELVRRVRGDIETPHSVFLTCGSCLIEVETNAKPVADELNTYFAPFLSPSASPHIKITALEMPPPDLGLKFVDWPRDAGKIGRKDSYLDMTDGRACRKVRTNMQYLLGDGQRIIFGECLKNVNQVINLVVSQYISWQMNKGWALCHASGITLNGKGMAFAAFSGGGKSTLALHMVRKGYDFVSNDRSLIGTQKTKTFLCGVPKHPRINPGTVLNNPALEKVIPASRQKELSLLSRDEIWELEEKYDALIDQLFGPDRFKLDTPLNGFLILNWDRNSKAATRIEEVDIAHRPDLLSAVMKPPGPFHIPEGQQAPSGFTDVHPEDYLPVLSTIPVFEATGQVDFDQACGFCEDHLS